MMAAVFRFRLSPDVGQDYAKRPAEMFGYPPKMPGFRSVKGCTAEDGQSLALVEFDTTEQPEALPKHGAHLQAQREGRNEFDSEYRLQACAVVRTTEFGPAEQ